MITGGPRPSIFELELPLSDIYFNHSNYRFELRKSIFFSETGKLLHLGTTDRSRHKDSRQLVIVNPLKEVVKNTYNLIKAVLRIGNSNQKYFVT